MNSASVDLVHLDPPFDSKADHAAPTGSRAAGAAFEDTWTLRDVSAEGINPIGAGHPASYRVILAATTDGDNSRFACMAPRLSEMRRIPSRPAPSACTATRPWRLVRGWSWTRSSGGDPSATRLPGVTSAAADRGATSPASTTSFCAVRQEISCSIETTSESRIAPKGWAVRTIPCGGDTKGRRRSTSLIHWARSRKTGAGYPTRKSLAFPDRIIRASSNEGGVVLDPFCGCAAACISAEKLKRQLVGIDISPKAADLVVEHMNDELGLLFRGAHRTDIPARTDIGKVISCDGARNKRHLYSEQGGRCTGCGEHFRPQNLEVDHIIPRAKGGTDHFENLQLPCGHCNRVKGNRGMEYLRVKLQLAA